MHINTLNYYTTTYTTTTTGWTEYIPAANTTNGTTAGYDGYSTYTSSSNTYRYDWPLQSKIKPRRPKAKINLDKLLDFISLQYQKAPPEA